MDFEVLKDLVRTISKNKIKQIEVLGNPGSSDTRTEELYESIYTDRLNSDDEAAKHFFGTDEKDPNYRKLRNRLIRQLINTSFFVDVQQAMFNERGRALFNCYRDYAAAYVLRSQDAHKASVYVLQQLLTQTTKFEFTELSADICRQLRQQYALSPSDRVNHEKFSELHRSFEKKRFWESKAYDYHENLIHYYISNRSSNQEVHDYAQQYFEELFPMAPEIDTIQYYTYTYTIGVIRYTAINNCQKTIALCDEALELLQAKKISNRGSLLSFGLQKLACLTQLRVTNGAAQETVDFCLSLVIDGEYNWFRAMETQFYYFLYARRYEEALQTFGKVIQHNRFNILSGSTRDMWTLHGGYLHLLAVLGKLEQQQVEAIAGYFNPKTARFSNDFEVLDKEKEGMNIPLVLLPVLYNIAQGSNAEDDFGRSIDALDKYRKRYLENDTNRRSAIFLKMVLALAKKEFDGQRAARKMEKERALLEKEPAHMSSQSFAVEVIPYEDIWEMLMEIQAD